MTTKHATTGPASYHVMPRASRFVPRTATAVSQPHGEWLRRERRARGWNVAQMARKLREAATSAGDTLPSRETLLVMIHRWESDRSGIGERYRLHYCRAFQVPADWFGNPAAPGSLPADGAGPSGTGHNTEQHPDTMATRPSPASDPAGPAGQLPYLRDRMHAAVDQLCRNEDRDQFCFLLGYVSALLSANPRTPGVGSPRPAGPDEGDSRDD